jgi:hypothetical protein
LQVEHAEVSGAGLAVDADGEEISEEASAEGYAGFARREGVYLGGADAGRELLLRGEGDGLERRVGISGADEEEVIEAEVERAEGLRAPEGGGSTGGETKQ